MRKAKTKTWLRLAIPTVAAVVAVALVSFDIASTEVRIEVDTRFAMLEFQGGELLSTIAREITLYDIDGTLSGEPHGALADLTISAATGPKGVALAGVTFPGPAPVRMTAQVQSRNVFDLTWHPHADPLAVVTPAGAVMAWSDGARHEQASEALDLFQPAKSRSRLSVGNSTNGGDVFRTRELQAISFTPPMQDGNGIAFSEIVSGTLVLSELENKQIDVPHGETLTFDIAEPATLSMELREDSLKLVFSGSVSDIHMGSGRSRWSVMPSWFEYAARQTWGKALAALLVVLVVPIVVETLYTK